MTKKLIPLLLIFAMLLLGACNKTTPTPEPTATSAPQPTAAATATSAPEPATPPEPPAVDHIVISEVLTGKKGNNNYEFIELYNPTDQPLDLQGLSLWYQLNDKQEPVRLARWTGLTLIPGQGHYLLVRAEQDVGVAADATFTQALNLAYGGVALQKSNKDRVDAVAWGKKAPVAMTEGQPAPGMKNGQSLERLPGGDAGNGQDADDNAADFVLNPDPQPQNTGSDLTPPVAKRLVITAQAPESAEPGGSFEYVITVTNHTGQDVHNVVASLLLSPLLKAGDLPDGIVREKNAIMWQIPELADGDSASVSIPVIAPWTYFDAVLQSYTVLAEDWPNAAVGPTVITRIEGGVIPIGTARTLQGAQLTLEGVATMYTGGFYAGGGNVKFYVEDDTGGIQVQVFGGDGVVNIHIGDTVQVKGTIGAYRGATQIVPDIVPDDVQILAKADPANLPKPAKVAIADALKDENLLGRLVQVQGKVIDVQEFTYSYSIDLADDQGNILNLYVDKGTHINPEAIEKGQLYRAKGILEVRDGKVQLYPRLQSDLSQVFPPELLVTADAPLAVQPGQAITYTASIFNHTDAAMTNVVVSANTPKGADVIAISRGGTLKNGRLQWTLPELAGEGGRADVWFAVTAPDSPGGQIAFDGFSAVSDQWPEPATSGPLSAFLGDAVPIWAIQGPGERSPYALKWATTEGVVTGVFPDLPGFFIQDIKPDDDLRTSEGLFINASQLEEFPEIAEGDVVRVYGQIKETSQQTQILVESPDDITVIDEGEKLPQPVALDPPAAEAEAEPYFEALEGMLVAAPGPNRAMGPTSKYGEYVIAPPGHDDARLWRGQDHGYAIMVDDGSSAKHDDRSTLPYVVATGDIVEDVVGPLAYTYGHYKIEPIKPPVVKPVDHPIPQVPPLQANQFALMTWNAENVFDAKEPNPKDPPLPSPGQYHLALEKMAATIADAGYPTVVGLQEIENIGVLQDLADEKAIKEQAYQPVLIEGTDSRGIDVGYLVRGDAEILDVQQIDAPEGLTSRPPLVIKVKMPLPGGPVEVYVINNHFSSMSAGVEITEPRRTAQAKWNVHIIEDIILKDDPDAMIAVMGDLNSFFDSKPVQTLRDAGLKHVLDFLPADQRYTYIFQGDSQVLDHILVTPNLYELLQDVVILHVNADFPPPIPDDPSPIRKSDHDPIIAIFGE